MFLNFRRRKKTEAKYHKNNYISLFCLFEPTFASVCLVSLNSIFNKFFKRFFCFWFHFRSTQLNLGSARKQNSRKMQVVMINATVNLQYLKTHMDS